MKRIGDPSFFRTTDRLFAAGTSRSPQAQGRIDEVQWTRERHSYTGIDHAFSLEVITVRSTEKPEWTLMIVKEFWWQPPSGEVFKSLQWAHVVAGRRADPVAWLKRQEQRLDAAGL